MIIPILFIIAGILALWFGSELVVNAAKRIAQRIKVSELVIGLTIVSLGTSIPEISTNIAAGLSIQQGVPASGIAIGNIIGSCLGQITFILGICGLFGTFYYKRDKLMRDGTVMLGAIVVVFIVAHDLQITQFEGILLMLTYVGYLIYISAQEKVFTKTKKAKNHNHTIIDVVKILFGTGIVVVGSYAVVTYGVTLAEFIGIKATLIGLFVGLGTSLPELTVSLKALHQKAHSLSLGNLLGSNITDPLFSLGAGASIAGFAILPQTLLLDIPFWLVGTLIALLLLSNDEKFDKAESGALILFYGLFMYLQFFMF
jgi:cation:H+ antiporter